MRKVKIGRLLPRVRSKKAPIPPPRRTNKIAAMSVRIDPETNLRMFVKIGNTWLTAVVDTGAGRGLIHQDIALGLARSDAARHAVSERIDISNDIRCEGVEDGRKLNRLLHCRNVKMSLAGTSQVDGGYLEHELDLQVCEMPGMSEPLILGRRELKGLGFRMFDDDPEGNPKFSFDTLSMDCVGIGQDVTEPPEYMLRPKQPKTVIAGETAKIPVEVIKDGRRVADSDSWWGEC
jgi:hypothetical protein